MWIIWPRQGEHVDIVYNFGKIALSSRNPNWSMRWEGGGFVSTGVRVNCAACGLELGVQWKPGDGSILFSAHITDCPFKGEVVDDVH